MHILITGGHSGLGLEFVKQAVDLGHDVSIVARSKDRMPQMGDLANKVANLFVADLAVASDRARLCEEVAHRLPSLDILVNNAAVLLPEPIYSSQGNEMHHEVNTLAPIDLMVRLRPLLAAGTGGRVVNVVSDNMDAKAIDADEVRRPTQFRKLFGSYMLSKTALAHGTAYLADQADWAGITLVSVTPGPNKTAMTAGTGMPFWLKPIRALAFSTPDVGAKRILEAAIRHDIASGSFIKKGKVAPLGFKMSRVQFHDIIGQYLDVACGT